jgi:hypothetical protein
VRTGSQGTLFYVVRTSKGYFVWEATPEAVFDRMKKDPTLNARLDRTPFLTRGEAEHLCRALWQQNKKKNAEHCGAVNLFQGFCETCGKAKA